MSLAALADSVKSRSNRPPENNFENAQSTSASDRGLAADAGNVKVKLSDLISNPWIAVAMCVAALIDPRATGSLHAAESTSAPAQSLILVLGASGSPQYEISFYQWSERWLAAAKRADVPVTVIGRHRGEEKSEFTDYQLLKQAVEQAAHDPSLSLWIVMIGHGTFDRKVARFNLTGPDLSANDLADWLKVVKKPTAIINCFSSSGPFITALSGPNRVVISGTKSGTEINFSRFGDYISTAIDDPTADLDKDRQTSLWEAFLTASRRVTEFYEAEGRIATEHALLDDNGDRKGARADQFRGLTPISSPQEGLPLDGRQAHQWHLVPNETDAAMDPQVRARRNELELAIERLRDQKSSLPEDEYFKKLEQFLIPLAELNELSDQ